MDSNTNVETATVIATGVSVRPRAAQRLVAPSTVPTTYRRPSFAGVGTSGVRVGTGQEWRRSYGPDACRDLATATATDQRTMPASDQRPMFASPKLHPTTLSTTSLTTAAFTKTAFTTINHLFSTRQGPPSCSPPV